MFSQELGFPAVSLDFTSKQSHKWQFVLQGTWFVRCCGRDQKLLCVVCLKCLLTFPLLLHVTVGFGLFKPKIRSVFHHDRLNCKITDEQGLGKKAAGDSSVGLSCGSGNELGQASKSS